MVNENYIRSCQPPNRQCRISNFSRNCLCRAFYAETLPQRRPSKHNSAANVRTEVVVQEPQSIRVLLGRNMASTNNNALSWGRMKLAWVGAQNGCQRQHMSATPATLRYFKQCDILLCSEMIRLCCYAVQPLVMAAYRQRAHREKPGLQQQQSAAERKKPKKYSSPFIALPVGYLRE